MDKFFTIEINNITNQIIFLLQSCSIENKKKVLGEMNRVLSESLGNIFDSSVAIEIQNLRAGPPTPLIYFETDSQVTWKNQKTVRLAF